MPPGAADVVPDPGPTLPAWKACVIQFTRESGKTAAVFAGRVEHLSSGRRVRFESREELVAVLERILDEVDDGVTPIGMP